MKIRKLFDKKIYKPKGHVQIDELFLGSPAKNSHKQKIMSKDITAYNTYNTYRTWVPRKRNDYSKKKDVVFWFGFREWKISYVGFRNKMHWYGRVKK